MFKFWGFCTMARDIKLDQIRARLGDLDKPRDYDPYKNEGQQDFDNNDEGGDDEGGGSTINAGFIATMLGLFIAVSGGTYMFTEGINPIGLLKWRPGVGHSTEFVSKVESICKPLWHSPGWNSDALACYMVESPNRFCDVQEREHFVGLFRRFRMDIEMQKGKVIAEITSGDTFKKISKAIEDEENGIKRPKPKPQPKNKYIKNLEIEDAVKLFAKNVLDPSTRAQNPELSMMLRKLLDKGYFQISEFGIFKDQIVTDAAFELPADIKSPCKS